MTDVGDDRVGGDGLTGDGVQRRPREQRLSVRSHADAECAAEAGEHEQ
ncbi:hypothetical protein MUN74_02525 [Agromyces endophyticus]|nr:hypothetical protein [Agromyces sp. H17E-10]UOQ89815.1 hypothetical protein MUN74_02525 [Agromyces sp. H17E-10]